MSWCSKSNESARKVADLPKANCLFVVNNWRPRPLKETLSPAKDEAVKCLGTGPKPVDVSPRQEEAGASAGFCEDSIVGYWPLDKTRNRRRKPGRRRGCPRPTRQSVTRRATPTTSCAYSHIKEWTSPGCSPFHVAQDAREEPPLVVHGLGMTRHIAGRRLPDCSGSGIPATRFRPTAPCRALQT